MATIVLAHGFIYVGPASPVRTFTAWTGRSLLLGSALTGDPLKTLSWVLHILTAAATLACAASIALAPTFPGWWRPLAIVSGAGGLLAFLVFWDGRPQRAFQQGAIGALISAVLVK